MSFHLRTFPMTWSDLERSNQGHPCIQRFVSWKWIVITPWFRIQKVGKSCMMSQQSHMCNWNRNPGPENKIIHQKWVKIRKISNWPNLFYDIWESHICYRNWYTTPILRDTGNQSRPQMVKKIEKQKFQICSMTSEKAKSAIWTDIRPRFREIQAPKVGEKWKIETAFVTSHDTGPQSWRKW